MLMGLQPFAILDIECLLARYLENHASAYTDWGWGVDYLITFGGIS